MKKEKQRDRRGPTVFHVLKFRRSTKATVKRPRRKEKGLMDGTDSLEVTLGVFTVVEIKAEGCGELDPPVRALYRRRFDALKEY
jgi:hypothetical protein